MLRARTFRRIAIALLIPLVILSISVIQVNASEVPFYWNSIDVDLDVQQNGDMWVTETQEYVFTSDYSNQRYRYIPMDKVGRIQDVTVTEQGQSLEASTGIENQQFWIRWQHSLNPPETRTFLIKYRVMGGLHGFENKTQLNWRGIFADRKAPVQAGTVTVHLPEALAGKVMSYISYGVPATSQVIDDRTFKFVADRALQPGEELKVQIIFPALMLNLSQSGWQAIDKILQFVFQNFLLILFGMIAGSILLSIPITLILDRRCPQCRKFTRKSQSHTLVPATPNRMGKVRVTQYCNACSYHQEFETSVAYNDGRSTGDGYYGGGDGGGGGCGGDGGGGGGGG